MNEGLEVRISMTYSILTFHSPFLIKKCEEENKRRYDRKSLQGEGYSVQSSL